MRLACVLALLGLAAAAPAAEPALPTTAQTDAARADLIERVARSIIHVKGVRAAEPPFDPFTGMDMREREKMLRRNPGILGQMTDEAAEPMREEGSAFIFDSARGLAITSDHIVARSVAVSVVLPDGREQPAEVVGLDEETGIAVLRIKDATLPALPLATKRPRAGESALIVGKMIPFGTILASQGMVMGDAFGPNAERGQLPALSEFFALDNLLPNGGMGGGPAVNMKGEVIGLISATYGARGYGQDGVTLALRMSELRSVIDELVARGKIRRSMIGLRTQCGTKGCQVVTVQRGSPAEIAGIKLGDRVLSVGGIAILSDSALRRIIASTPIGTSLSFSVMRGPIQKTIALSTVERLAPAKDADTDDSATGLSVPR
jgi:S1-C subfamily serine protease